MGGGLLQLAAATGPQDERLTVNPERTFWKQAYHRHANFAVESIAQTMSGSATFGGHTTCTLSRSGDLVTGLVAEIVMKRGTGTPFYPAENLLREVELQIGAQRFDLLTNTWLRIYDELYRSVDAREANRQMADFVYEPVGSIKRFYVSLPFWFCRGEAGAALPLIALQYHEVQLRFKFEEAANIPGIDTSFDPQITLWADYVFLDPAERRWFASTAHECLIEQIQVDRQTVDVRSVKYESTVILPFNHPVKYLVWVLKVPSASHGVFTGSGKMSGLESQEVFGPVAEAGLQLNGTDRFKPRKGSYFRLHHACSAFGQAPSVGVYVYSFALRPASWLPSGTLNMSRLEDVRLVLTTKAAKLANDEVASNEDETTVSATDLKFIEVYARNYNVVRIDAGMAGLLFAA